MVWFLVALVLLVAAVALLWLDHRSRGGAGGRADSAQTPADRGGGELDSAAAVDSADVDDDEAEQFAPVDDPASEQPEPSDGAPDAAEPADPVEPAAAAGGAEPAIPATAGAADEATEPDEPEDAGADADPDAPVGADEQAGPGLGAAAAGAGVAAAGAGAAGAAAAGPSKLSDRVRRFLPARNPHRGADRPAPEAEPEPADPLAGSPVVQWLEQREFAPTQTPAPDFRHGDFAGGLPALGTVSHGVFRGRRAIMGVAGGRAVLALQRGTASDVVLDLSRPDVDAEPGFHDAGEVAALEARTSDYGRLELVDRDRLADAVRELPSDVRRVWAEGEWMAATVDGAENPATWDDTVVVLYEAAGVLAPLPPVGGRARPLPAEIDPGAPGAVEGPEADPAGGVPDPNARRAAPGADGAEVAGGTGEADAGAGQEEQAAEGAGLESVDSAEAADSAVPVEARRTGHLRLVPDRREGMRDLGDKPVVADRGDEEPAPEAEAAGGAAAADESAESADPAEADPFSEIMGPPGPVASRGDVAADHLEPREPLSRPTRGVGHTYPEDASVPPLASGATSGAAGIKPIGSEDDDEDDIRSEVERFDAARIDGGSDFDESSTGRHGEASEEPGGSHGESSDESGGRHGEPSEESGGRHGADDVDPSEVTQRLSVADLAARMGVDPAEMRSADRRRRRRAAPDPDEENDVEAAGPEGRERPGVEPDVERTARLDLPPDITE